MKEEKDSWIVNGFEDAVRTRVPLKIALTGPSHAGKTLSALLLAKEMGERICVIDTENGSASLYADRVKFKTKSIYAPYTVQKFHEAMEIAKAAQCDVLVIDSISHEWGGSGGLLEKKYELDKRGGNSFTNFAGITKEHELFKAYLLHAPMHVICTIRSKTRHVIEQDEKGKSRVRKLGLELEQREGMEYEFTVVWDLDKETHVASVSKDRTGLFDNDEFLISQETGKRLMEWWKSAAPAKPLPLPITKEEWDKQVAEGVAIGWTEHDIGGWLRAKYGVTSVSQLMRDQLDAFNTYMQAHPKLKAGTTQTPHPLKAASQKPAVGWDETCSEAQRKRLWALCNGDKRTRDELLFDMFGEDVMNDAGEISAERLTKGQIKEVFTRLESKEARKA